MIFNASVTSTARVSIKVWPRLDDPPWHSNGNTRPRWPCRFVLTHKFVQPLAVGSRLAQFFELKSRHRVCYAPRSRNGAIGGQREADGDSPIFVDTKIGTAPPWSGRAAGQAEAECGRIEVAGGVSTGDRGNEVNEVIGLNSRWLSGNA